MTVFQKSARGPFAKICGVTNAQDAALSVDAGADALGVNFFEGSTRAVTLAEALGWLTGLPVARVAVVVNPSEDLVEELRGSGVFDAIQFHGDESPEFCARCGFAHWIKAVRVKEDGAWEEVLKFDTPYLLLDSWIAGQHGGTGVRLDWNLARDFVEAHRDRKVILAGGLNPCNVRDALRLVRPFAVDVASGVEISPREKDEYLVREFVRRTKEMRKSE